MSYIYECLPEHLQLLSCMYKELLILLFILFLNDLKSDTYYKRETDIKPIRPLAVGLEIWWVSIIFENVCFSGG